MSLLLPNEASAVSLTSLQLPIANNGILVLALTSQIGPIPLKESSRSLIANQLLTFFALLSDKKQV